MISIGAALGDGGDPLSRALHAVQQHAPYLHRLAQRRGEALSIIRAKGYEATAEKAIAEAQKAAAESDFVHGMKRLRDAKADLHLALGLYDLTAAPSTHTITELLTRFADHALQSALALAENAMLASGDLRAVTQGYCLVAMGKHGARELNYSSDVDVIAFYSPNWLAPGPRLDAREAAVKLTRLVVRAMQEVTEDGYVFRVDLRLRPDPNATPVAVSFAAAERYYQSVGENWERAAFIKARVCAGDIEMGEAFLNSLRPFIWRRHLDYAAIDDIRSVQRQIHRFHGSAPLDQASFDVKLGRGGIRDIELFVQAQQLILGGRTPSLRTPQTVQTLQQLAQLGVLTSDQAQRLIDAYCAWRSIEHRIQMREDEQSHTLAADPVVRTQIAHLCGYRDLDAFDNAVIALRGEVVALCESCATPIAAPPDTLPAPTRADVAGIVSAVGFTDAEAVEAQLAKWREGSVRALKSPRARALLEAMTPSLLAACARTKDSDAAFLAFAALLDRLPAGVQVLALLQARPDVMAALVGVLAVAPALATDIAQRPTLIDAMGEARFLAPIGGEIAGARTRALQAILGEATDFEAIINGVRRFHREEAFRITVHLLRRDAGPRAAGAAFAELADACVGVIAQAALREVERQFGRCAGRFVVLALGKFAGGELSARSDLDVMVVYDCEVGALSDGARALPAGDFYARFAQRLISGLSAPTEEGALYDIDVQLRPSGSKGPVAVRLSSFERYYREDAWTWELQALTRLRGVVGDASLLQEVQDCVRAVLSLPRAGEKIFADVAAMRGRLEKERRADGVFDVKLSPGGLMDIEFIAQALLLATPQAGPLLPLPSTVQALSALARLGVLTPAQDSALRAAATFYLDLQQIFRAAAQPPSLAAQAPKAFQALLMTAGGVETLEALEAVVRARQVEVRALFQALVGAIGDGKEGLSR